MGPTTCCPRIKEIDTVLSGDIFLILWVMSPPKYIFNFFYLSTMEQYKNIQVGFIMAAWLAHRNDPKCENMYGKMGVYRAPGYITHLPLCANKGGNI